MNNQLTKSLSLILGLAIVGSVAFGIEKVYAEEAQTSTKILAQLPSPVRRVNNPRAFVEECKIKLAPISGCQVVQYIIVSEYTCGAKAASWEYNKTRYVLMSWSKINDNDLILLARRAAKADL